MHTIAVLNKKGGVGKSTLAHHLSGELGSRGLRVLAVDLDFQSNLTTGLLGVDGSYFDPAVTSAAVVADGPLPMTRDLIHPTAVQGVDLIPCSASAEGLDTSDPSADLAFERQGRLAELLADVDGEYDYAILDCRPDAHAMTWNAILAAGHLLIPVNPEKFGSLGIGPMIELVQAARANPLANPGLAVLGIVVNRTESQTVSLHRAFELLLREEFPHLTFAATIPKSIAFAEAVENQLPVCRHAPRSKAAKAVRDLADEVLAKLEIAAEAALAVANG